MATGNIRITPQTLITESNKLKGLADQHDTTFKSMTKLVDGLKSQWEGQALDAFSGSYDHAKTELAKFRQAIDVFTSRMVLAAKKLEETDIALKNAFK